MKEQTLRAIYGISRRADSVSSDTLLKSFVSVGNIGLRMSSPDHQVVFGRRGTGKTHSLKYLVAAPLKNSVPLYLDMRQVGSNRSIYTDYGLPPEARATTLLVDFLQALHDQLLDIVLRREEDFDLSVFGPILDGFGAASSTTRVVGRVRRAESRQAASSQDSKIGAEAALASAPSLSASSSFARSQSKSVTFEQTEEGEIERYVVFGDVAAKLKEFCQKAPSYRFVLLIDEWSDIPTELQPLLADLIRRTVVASGIILKIAAIEQKARFADLMDTGGYIGIQLGADVMADINLDDFMVFDLDESKSVEFFKELLFRHYVAVLQADGETPAADTSDRFILEVFTEKRAFEEFVRAVEGVPRDAINLLVKAASRSADTKVSVEAVRIAARDWYRSDKIAFVEQNPNVSALLNWIIDKVIRGRKARAFLFPSNRREPVIDILFDARLLHILKKNISSKEGGERYDVYTLDYGCYVDLLATADKPGALLFDESDRIAEAIEVPEDDYRAIRRATLDIEEFWTSRSTAAGTFGVAQR